MSEKFKNPFDFMLDDQKIIINNIPEQTQPKIQIFKPYEITGGIKQVYNPPTNYKPDPFNPNRQYFEQVKAPSYNQYRTTDRPKKQYQLNENGDPPLLDDLGIDPENIKQKMKLVILLQKPSEDVLGNPDLSGPISIALLLGVLLLFSGKIHFGDIYGVSILGTILLYFLMNFMSENILIPLYDVMSILGYGLIPMLILGSLNIFTRLNGMFGLIVALGCASWSSYAATIFFEQVLKLKNKKWLVAYPVFLFYMTFVLIVIF